MARSELISPKFYVEWSVKLLMATMSWCLFVLPLTTSFSNRASNNELLVAALAVFTGITLPGGGVVAVYCGVEGWNSLKAKKVVKWHAQTTLAVVSLICLGSLVYLTHAFWIAELTEPLRDGNLNLKAVSHERSLIARVQFLCTFSAWLLPMALSLGLFAKESTTS